MEEAPKREKTLAFWYFSTTGNTKYLGELVEKNLESLTKDKHGETWDSCKINVELVDMLPFCKQLSDMNEGKAKIVDDIFPKADGYIFASMTYCYRVPNIVKEVLMAIPDKNIEKKPFYCVGVNAGNAGYLVREIFLIMSKKGGISAGTTDVKGPSNWFPGPSFKPDAHWDKKYIDSFEKKVYALPSMFAKVLSTNKPIKDCKMKGIYAPIQMITDKMVGSSMKSMKWHDDKCVRCNICVNKCPTNALEFVNVDGKEGNGKKVVKLNLDLKKCNGCLTCINNCPKRAIDNKKSVKFKELYRFSEKVLIQDKE